MKKRKILSLTLTLVCCCAMSITAFAAPRTSVNAGNYGTLTGTIKTTSTRINGYTIVSKNNDNGRLVLKLDEKNIKGENIARFDRISDSGKNTFSGGVAKLSKGYSVYGTHGVQGGSKNPAAAVYTNTTL